MDIEGDDDLKDFANVCRLFPLPRVVLFPHAVLPLHIFEPRYRQMTEDALAGDKLVTIVQWRAPYVEKPGVEPALEEVACLGRILQHERLPDGRFNFLLLGRKRVRLGREIPSGKLYRTAEAEILEDEYDGPPLDGPIAEVATMFRGILEAHGTIDPDLEGLLDASLPPGALTDLVAHSLGLPPMLKQQLLAETRVGRRVEILREVLRHVAEIGRPAPSGLRTYPPPFSDN